MCDSSQGPLHSCGYLVLHLTLGPLPAPLMRSCGDHLGAKGSVCGLVKEANGSQSSGWKQSTSADVNEMRINGN